MSIVDRIVSLCEAKKINGIMLGEYLGLKKSPLTDWKNGKAKPTVSQIISCCEILATTPDFLLLGSFSKTDDEDELLSTYRLLDSRGKHIVQATAYSELDRLNSLQNKEDDSLVKFQAIARGGQRMEGTMSQETFDSLMALEDEDLP